jgi:acyl-CoA dehydrogenase
MDLTLTPDERAFEAEVEAFVTETLTPALRRAQALTVSVFPEADVAIAWQKILNARGWGAPSWPVEHGGPGWTHVQRFLFDRVTAFAGAPLQHPLGLRMVGPVIMRFGSAEQKAICRAFSMATITGARAFQSQTRGRTSPR